MDSWFPLRPSDGNPSNLSYGMARAIVRAYCALFIRTVHVEGLKDLPPGPKILAANHANVTDGFILPLLLGERLRFLIQAEVFTVPVIGRLLRSAGQIPVFLGHGKEALDSALERLRCGDTVVVFPEGRLDFGQPTRRAGAGVILLALRSRLPVIPVGFFTPHRHVRVLTGRVHQRRTRGGWQFGGEAFVQVGRPWRPEDTGGRMFDYPRVRVLTAQLMLQIDQLVQQAKADCAHRTPRLPGPVSA